jgi:hypothetical protein
MLTAKVLRRLAISAVMLSVVATPLLVEVCARDRDNSEKEGKENEKHKDKSEKESRRKARRDEKEKSTVTRKEDDAARLAGSDLAATHPIGPALEAARSSREAIRKIPAYTCTFTKQEQLKKGPPLRQVMILKFRREPFSVYLRYIDPHPGREVIFVDGRNKGKLLVHEPSGLASFVGTISLAPTSSEALKENRYPVTMIGMERVLDTAVSDWELALKSAEVKVDKYPQARVGDFDCTMFEVVYPRQESFKFHKARVYFDKKTQLPVHTEQYGFPGKSGEESPLLEQYSYSDLKIDLPISDSDFDLNNSAYGFK